MKGDVVQTNLNTFLRPEVAAFAIAMENRLREGRIAPSNSLKSLYSRVKTSIVDLSGSLYSYHLTDSSFKPLPKTHPDYCPLAARNVLRKTAGIACSLMMMSDICGCLEDLSWHPPS